MDGILHPGCRICCCYRVPLFPRGSNPFRGEGEAIFGSSQSLWVNLVWLLGWLVRMKTENMEITLAGYIGWAASVYLWAVLCEKGSHAGVKPLPIAMVSE